MESVLMMAVLHALCLYQGLQGISDSSTGNGTGPTKRDKPGFQHSGSYILNLSQACSGTLEALHQGRWVPVSFMNLSSKDIRSVAHSACENLGCGRLLRQVGKGTAHNDSCLSDCIIKDSTVHNCTDDPLSRCLHTVKIVCEHQEVRLAEGSDNCTGRVELLDGGEWGSVCSDDWDLRGGNVVCAQLGCGTAMVVTTKAVAFGLGTGPIHINKLNCTGTESNLWQCSTQTPAHKNYCGHKDDAGLVCSGSVNVPFTLKPTELNKTNWTTAVLSGGSAQEYSSSFSVLALCCIGLAAALLLLLISNICTCSYYRRQKNYKSCSGVALQTGEAGDSNDLCAVTAQTTVDGGLAVRASPHNSSSDTSSDSDYEHYYNSNIRSPAVDTVYIDADRNGECSQAPERICSEGNALKHMPSCDVPDSESTSSGECYYNPPTEMEKLLNEASDDAAVVGECFQVQGRMCTEGNALKSTRGDSTDSDSTSSGECYDNVEDNTANLLESLEQNPSPVQPLLSHHIPQVTGNSSLPQPSFPNEDVNQMYLVHSLQFPPLHSSNEQTQSEWDSTDSDSTSSGECYENVEDNTANLLESLEQNPSPVQPHMSHHIPQVTGNSSLPQPSFPNEDESSTSSDDYENVPEIDNMDDFGAGRPPNQSSSDSDYDEVSNW